MKKLWVTIILGVAAGALFFGIVLAKQEAGSITALPMVMYGYNGTTLVAIAVNSTGVLQLH